MPSAAEIAQQVEVESERRRVLSVPAFAGGFLYVLSAIVISGTLKGAPKVGLIEGLTPALSGVSEQAVSPKASEVKFFSHHAFTLIVGSVLAAIAVGALVLVLLLLADATRFRRPTTWVASRPLVLFGGICFALISVVHEVIVAIETHKFAVGHDFSAHAVDQALKFGAPNVIVQYIALLSGVAFAVGVIAVMVNALRTGLLPRWMGVLGIFSGLLLFFPTAGELQVVPALWMVMMGILYAGRWPNAEPPAWAAGEARPWPSGAQARAGKDSGEVVPAPSLPVQAGTSRKRRKRGARG